MPQESSLSLERRALSLVGDVQGLLELDELRIGLLSALAAAIPSDWVSINDIGPAPDNVIAIVDPPLPASLHAAFGRYAHESPLVVHHRDRRDGRPTRLSDLVTTRQLHSLDVYKHVYSRIGLEFQIAFTLPHTPSRLLGVALSRRSRDFTDDERDLLSIARPHLIQAYRNAVIHTQALDQARGDGKPRGAPSAAHLRGRGLTERQAEVLRLVAMGESDRDIAARLGISHRTVQKHLERCYRTLGVSGRAEAAGAARLPAPPPPRGEAPAG